MGCLFTKQNGGDMAIKLIQTRQQRLIKILLLGPSDSGKTTIIKQLQNIHHADEISNITPQTIQDVIITFMQTLCDESITLSEKSKQATSVHPYNQYLRDEILALRSAHLTEDIAFKIKQLWLDDGIQATFEKRHCFQIDENVHYFLDKIDNICSENYSPDFEDYVRISRRSVGCSCAKFVSFVDGFGEYEFLIPDVGGSRSERKKWWRPKIMSDDLNAIVYVVAISEYNQVLFEDNKTNRLVESLNLFKSVLSRLMEENMNFFKDKFVLLLFNKYDLFEDKIQHIPIDTVEFDDFPDDMNPNNALDVYTFISNLFLHVLANKVNGNANGNYKVDSKSNSEREERVRILKTTAIDQESIADVFTGVAWDIIQKHEKQLQSASENKMEMNEMDHTDESCISYSRSNLTESEQEQEQQQQQQTTNKTWWPWNKNHRRSESESTNATTGSTTQKSLSTTLELDKINQLSMDITAFDISDT